MNLVRALPLFVLLLLTGSPSAPAAEKDLPPFPVEEVESLFFLQGWLTDYQDPAPRPAWLGTVPNTMRELAALPATPDVRPPYDLEEKPGRTIWWKYPVYAVVGFPRDLVDSLFGALAPLPLINVITGAYVVSPFPWVLRHHEDWHRYPGLRNHNDHGWIDSESWGFFPSWNQMEFARVDQKELANRQLYNQWYAREQRLRQKEAQEHNAGLAARREDYLQATQALLEKGPLTESTLSELVYYTEIAPLDVEGRSTLAVALIRHIRRQPGAPWARQRLSDLLDTESQAFALACRGLLRRIQPEAPLFLVWTEYKLGNMPEALQAATQFAETTSNRDGALRLLFELSLARRDTSAAKRHLAALTLRRGPKDVIIQHGKGRILWLEGDYAAAQGLYETLTRGWPRQPGLQYMLGLVRLGQTARGKADLSKKALRAFEKARRFATRPADKAHYQRLAAYTDIYFQ